MQIKQNLESKLLLFLFSGIIFFLINTNIVYAPGDCGYNSYIFPYYSGEGNFECEDEEDRTVSITASNLGGVTCSKETVVHCNKVSPPPDPCAGVTCTCGYCSGGNCYPYCSGTSVKNAHFYQWAESVLLTEEEIAECQESGISSYMYDYCKHHDCIDESFNNYGEDDFYKKYPGLKILEDTLNYLPSSDFIEKALPNCESLFSSLDVGFYDLTVSLEVVPRKPISLF